MSGASAAPSVMPHRDLGRMVLPMPTSALVTIRLAPRLDSYPAPSESAQWGIRVEDCACGGMVVARPGEPVMRVVRAHQATQIHAAWRERTP